MRRHGLTVIFGLVVVAFFALVAAQYYAWTSFEAYCQVRAAELCLVVGLFAVFYVVAGLCRLIDYCRWKLHQFRQSRLKRADRSSRAAQK
ncbi:MAG: hypothetical protein EKK48_24005 [Candidatus Melainabacteria bacterium]|nr:MAG: hypothetical protein EKK48_24005 [Candidatus Melainabacteria bacterium]